MPCSRRVFNVLDYTFFLLKNNNVMHLFYVFLQNVAPTTPLLIARLILQRELSSIMVRWYLYIVTKGTKLMATTLLCARKMEHGARLDAVKRVM